MIRGPVWDDKVKGWTVKLHWSDKVLNQPKNLDDLQYRLRKHIMIRRLKKDVLSELPERQWHPFPITVTKEIKQVLNHPGWRDASKLYEMNPENFSQSVVIDGQMSTLRRLLGEAKAPAVADFVEDLLQSGVNKVVIGAYHRNVLDYLRRRLQKYGLTYMDGSTSSVAKQAAVDDFQKKDEVRIILGQIGPLGEGWTLTAAQDVVQAEFDWVPGKNDQLLDRIHRQGQKGDRVIGHVPIVPGTLDEKILATTIRKDQHIHLALDYNHKT